MIPDSLDFGQIFDDAIATTTVKYRDPMLDPYGNTSKATPTQLEAWDFVHEWTGKKHIDSKGKEHILAPLIGMIGAKGSSKTHFGGAFANHMGQNYPGSVGCLISNSYQQAKDNGGPLLMKLSEALGYEVEFYTSKKIRGRQYTNVYMVKIAPGIDYFVLVRSFDAIDLLEGAEIDWGWAEEIQDSDKDALTIFVSRVRGSGSPNAIFMAGMPEPGTHFQYKLLPKLGFIEKENFNGVIEKTIYDPTKGEDITVCTVGCLWEPSVFENIQNVGAEYVNRLLESYSPEDAERYVYGKRGGSRSDRVFYQYRDDVHRRGLMSKILTEYDPKEKLVISYDFNVYPMSTSMWQPKGWSDEWDQLIKDKDKYIHIDTKKVYDRPLDFAIPDRIVWAQVDEIEIWPDDPNGGMTQGMVMEIEKRYLNHDNYVVVLGDASGNQRRSSSTTTDWEIIGRSMQKFKMPVVKRGLISNHNFKEGRTMYSNPSQRDALQNANRMLMDAKRQVHVCFLPESKLASGGVAASLTALGFKADGTFDITAERKMDRTVPRSHFGDGYKYFAWYALPPQAFSNFEKNTIDRKTLREERVQAEEEFHSRSGWAF